MGKKRALAMSLFIIELCRSLLCYFAFRRFAVAPQGLPSLEFAYIMVPSLIVSLCLLLLWHDFPKNAPLYWPVLAVKILATLIGLVLIVRMAVFSRQPGSMAPKAIERLIWLFSWSMDVICLGGLMALRRHFCDPSQDQAPGEEGV